MQKKFVAYVMLFAMVIVMLSVTVSADDVIAKAISFEIKDVKAEAGSEIVIPIYVVGHSSVAGASIVMRCSQFSTTDIVDGDWVRLNKVISMGNPQKGIFDWISIYNTDVEEQTGIFAAYTVKINENAKPGRYAINLTSSDIVQANYDGSSKTFEGETVTAYLTVTESSNPTVALKQIYGQHGVGMLEFKADTVPQGLDVVWESSDTSVAEVEDGIVTVKGMGDVAISASVMYNGKKISGTYELELCRGDVDINGEVTNADAIQVARHLVKLVLFTDLQLKFADANGDGRVNNADLVAITRHIVE